MELAGLREVVERDCAEIGHVKLNAVDTKFMIGEGIALFVILNMAFLEFIRLFHKIMILIDPRIKLLLDI